MALLVLLEQELLTGSRASRRVIAAASLGDFFPQPAAREPGRAQEQELPTGNGRQGVGDPTPFLREPAGLRVPDGVPGAGRADRHGSPEDGV